MIVDSFTLTVLAVFSFCIGSCIASFLNVVIWRVPRGESITTPPSHCPKCGAKIRWWCNIPIFSYLLLRGKCADCKTSISPRYVLVELLGGLLFLLAFYRYGFFAPLAWVWISLMIVGTFIDFDHHLLPDFVTVGGMVFGVLISVVFWAIGAFTPYHFHNITNNTFYIPITSSLIGLGFGFGLLWLVRFLGTIAFKREAMGLGDVFLMGAIGALFGFEGVLVSLILSSFFGSIIGLIMVALQKTRLGKFAEIPYGPYICLGCLVWMFYGPELWQWYAGILAGQS